MKRAIWMFILLLSTVPLLAANVATGTWKLDVGKSRLASLPQQETVQIEDQGDNMLVTVRGTSHDGSPILIKFTAPWKGGKGTVLTAPFDTVYGRRTSDSSYNTTYLKDGKALKSDHAVVLQDGKVMRVIIESFSAYGRPISGIEFFTRAGSL